MQLTRGFLITIEGIDGSGKDTQFHKLRSWLEGMLNDEIAFWSEPDDESPMGALIRDMLTGRIPVEPDPFEFQRMFVIDRALNIFRRMKPCMQNRRLVLLERYAFSTVAYGMLSKRPPEDFIKLHYDVIGPSMVWPDTTIVLNVSAKTGLERIAERRKGSGLEVPNQFFERGDKLSRVREFYLKVAERTDIGGIAVVNGEQSPDAVFEEIKKIIEPRLPVAR